MATPDPTPAEHPHGTPGNPVIVRLADDQVVTIQRTARSIKTWILIGVLVMLIGALVATADIVSHFAHPDRIGTLLTIGGITFAFGVVILCTARFFAWWRHG